jgi:hypothetical protein
MNPQLLILRKNEMDQFDSGNRVYFVVVNLDKDREYPANFVCILPAQKHSIIKPSTEFSSVFGTDGLRLAKKLLKDALRDEDESQIRAEIERRLRILDAEGASRKLMLCRRKHFANAKY